MNKMKKEKKNKTIFWIAFRYFRTRKKVKMVSVVSIITILGAFIGTFAILSSLSVMNGFKKTIVDRAVNFEPDIRVFVKNYSEEFQDDLQTKISELENVEKVSPIVERKIIISNSQGQQLSLIKGISPNSYRKIIEIEPYLFRGDFLTDDITSTTFPEIVIGAQVANYLSIAIGDTISLLSPLDIKTYSAPTMKCIVKDIFQVDIFDYDYRAFIHIADMKYLLDDPLNHYLEVSGDKKFNKEEVKREISQLGVKSKYISTWKEDHKEVFSAMQVEKIGTFIVLNLIIVLSGFNLISSLLMLLLEKRWEVGILKGMGMNDKNSFRLYYYLGWLTGGSGMIFGMIFSLTLLLLQQYFPFIHLPGGGEVYIMEYLPVDVKLLDVIITFITLSLVISFSSWYPARKANKIKPLEAIRSKQ
ncbi:MAG: ABC transporter permease [Candidatus Marinimicrobia bacterium]|jgi:lipoprotein-releasing system permease protein|nr:ABC transporter permease [Candidatus Neomarinimicrobiota bacterium]